MNDALETVEEDDVVEDEWKENDVEGEEKEETDAVNGEEENMELDEDFQVIEDYLDLVVEEDDSDGDIVVIEQLLKDKVMLRGESLTSNDRIKKDIKLELSMISRARFLHEKEQVAIKTD